MSAIVRPGGQWRTRLFFACVPELHEVAVVFDEEVGGVEAVGAVFDAVVAVEAPINFFHLVEPFFGEVDAVGRAAEEEGHAVAVLDLYASGAGLAVGASAAEVACELGAVAVDDGLEVGGECGGGVLVGEPLVELALALDAPDGCHVVVLGEEGVGGGGVGDESAGEAFHGDEAHAGLAGALDDVELFAGGEVGEGVLEGFVEAAFDGFDGHALAVVGDADVAHLTLALRLEHGFVEAGAVAWAWAEGEVVELVEVDIVGAQEAEAGLEVGPEGVGGGGAGLGADDDVGAAPLEGEAEFVFAVGVEACGVEVVHAAVEGAADEADGVLFGDALYGQGSEAVAGDDEAGAAEGDGLHFFSVFCGQWSVVSGQWSVVSGQWSVVSGRWATQN